ncbi:MAG: IspD/TarI family cytidylyltransferase [Acidimicrobiia bacterium]
MKRVWAIVVAGGRGERYGQPKQFLPLGDVRLVDHAVTAARAVCDAVVIVLPEGMAWDGPAVECSVSGGDTRAASVRAGLAAVPDDAEVIVVHDAARPLAQPALFRAVIDAVRAGADGAVPALPVTDTVRRVHGDVVAEAVDRDGLVRVQTPQAFRADCLRAAHTATLSSGRRRERRLLRRRSAKPPPPRDATDDSGLVEASGAQVVVVPGDERNLKVTTTDDLARATALLSQ